MFDSFQRTLERFPLPYLKLHSHIWIIQFQVIFPHQIFQVIFFSILEALIPSKENITDSHHTTLTMCASFVPLVSVMERDVCAQRAEGNKYVENGFLSPKTHTWAYPSVVLDETCVPEALSNMSTVMLAAVIGLTYQWLEINWVAVLKFHSTVEWKQSLKKKIQNREQITGLQTGFDFLPLPSELNNLISLVVNVPKWWLIWPISFCFTRGEKSEWPKYLPSWRPEVMQECYWPFQLSLQEVRELRVRLWRRTPTVSLIKPGEQGAEASPCWTTENLSCVEEI